MAINTNKKFEWFLKKFGEPLHAQPIYPKTIEAFKGKLPDILLECWQQYGFCCFRDGMLWIVNPEEYKDIATAWLTGMGIPETDNFYIFARSGFGELFLWSEKTGQQFNIEVIKSRIFDNGSDEKYIKKEGSSEALLNFFTALKPSSLDLEDIDSDESIFEQAVAKFGPLKPDEMFTFEPALFLGGERNLKTVNKVNFFIQSEILASMGQREIMDIKGLAKKAFGKKP